MVIRELFAKLGLQVDDTAFRAADAAIGAVKGGLLALGGAVSAARVAMAAAIKSTADYASEIHDLSAATGVSTDNLQVLGYAGKLAGVGLEEVAQGLAHLSRSAFEASTAGGEAGAAFFRLGVDAYDATGKVKDINQLLPEVAAALGRIQNPTERTALAMQVFGRSGARLTQTLTKFGGDMEAVRKEAVKLGIVLDEKTIQAGKDLGDTIDRVNFAIKGVIYAIGTPLLGKLRSMLEGWVRWTEVNRRFIALRVHEAIGHVNNAMAGLYELGKAIVAHPTLTKWLLGIGAAALAISAPILAVSLLLAGLAEDLYLFFNNPKAETLTRTLVEGFDKLRKQLGIGDWLDEPVANMMKVLGTFFDWVVGEAGKLPERIARAMSPSSHASLSTELADFIKYTVAKVMIETARTPGARNLGMHALKAVEESIDADHAPGPAFKGRPGSQTGYVRIDGQYYPYDREAAGADGSYGAGLGVLAPSVSSRGLGLSVAPVFNLELTVNATGGNGRAIGEELGPVLRSQLDRWFDDTFGNVLAEAQAATDR
jgi:hypothetical protein